MISCDVIPKSFDTIIQVSMAIAAINLLIANHNNGLGIVKVALRMVGLSDTWADVAYIFFALCGGFTLICRLTGIPQNCKLSKIPGKSIVPIVVSSTGETSALSAKAVVAAKQAEIVAKQAADDAKIATKTVIDAIKKGDNINIASEQAEIAAKNAIIASKAVTIAKQAAAVPISAFVDNEALRGSTKIN
jgi:hypothetical protein